MARVQDAAVGLEFDSTAARGAGRLLDVAPHPDQRQGWLLVLGLALVLCILLGTTLNALGLFTLPITTALHCTNEQAAHLATAFIFSMTLTMPVAGWLLDRIAPRPVMAAGAVMAALGYLLAAQSPDIHRLTLAMALGGAGVGASTYVPAITLATRWIAPSRQGLAFGVLLAGASLGAVIFPVLLTRGSPPTCPRCCSAPPCRPRRCCRSPSNGGVADRRVRRAHQTRRPSLERSQPTTLSGAHGAPYLPELANQRNKAELLQRIRTRSVCPLMPSLA